VWGWEHSHEIRLFVCFSHGQKPQWIFEAVFWQYCHHQRSMRGLTQRIVDNRHGHYN